MMRITDEAIMIAAAKDVGIIQLTLNQRDEARAKVERLRAVIKWYLDQFPCFGIGSGKGVCASIDNEPGRCIELSDDPNEWCASGKFLRALDELDRESEE